MTQNEELIVNKELSNQERITKLLQELQTIQTAKEQVPQTSCQWWQLDAQEVAVKHVLINLTSICQFCKREGTEIKFVDGSYICRPCLRVKYYDSKLLLLVGELKS